MKKVLSSTLAVFAITALAQGLSVKESDITGKTSLVTIAQTSVNGTQESILADNAGFSLYTFESDSAGVSKCSGGCLTEWPPMHVPAGETVQAPFGMIKGNDGQNQLTLNGLPLYHYVSDKSPGNAFGEYPKWDVIVVTQN